MKLFFSTFTFALFVIFASSSTAQVPAKALFEQGTEALAQKDFATAELRFAQSLELQPHPPTANNLATALEEQGKLLEAEGVLVRLQDGNFGALNNEQRNTVGERIAEIRPRLGSLTVHVTGPASADVFINGHARGTAGAAATEITVNPGPCVAAFRANGFVEHKSVLSFGEGERKELAVSMARLQVQTEGPVGGATGESSPLTPTPSDEEASMLSSPWVWAGVGAVVAAGVVTAIVLSSGSSSGSDKDDGGYFGTVSALSEW